MIAITLAALGSLIAALSAVKALRDSNKPGTNDKAAIVAMVLGIVMVAVGMGLSLA